MWRWCFSVTLCAPLLGTAPTPALMRSWNCLSGKKTQSSTVQCSVFFLYPVAPFVQMWFPYTVQYSVIQYSRMRGIQYSTLFNSCASDVPATSTFVGNQSGYLSLKKKEWKWLQQLLRIRAATWTSWRNSARNMPVTSNFVRDRGWEAERIMWEE